MSPKDRAVPKRIVLQQHHTGFEPHLLHAFALFPDDRKLDYGLIDVVMRFMHFLLTEVKLCKLYESAVGVFGEDE